MKKLSLLLIGASLYAGMITASYADVKYTCPQFSELKSLSVLSYSKLNFPDPNTIIGGYTVPAEFTNSTDPNLWVGYTSSDNTLNPETVLKNIIQNTVSFSNAYVANDHMRCQYRSSYDDNGIVHVNTYVILDAGKGCKQIDGTTSFTCNS